MKVTVVDYGVGNLLSVARAFDCCGAQVIVTSDPQQIQNAERLVLPGVGAFKDAMLSLDEKGLIAPIKQFVSTSRPFLGICLGMQILFDSSEEFGEYVGLGLIAGKVVAIPKRDLDGRPQKIPNISWCELSERNSWKNTILNQLQEGEAVYFVHSYEGQPSNDQQILATYRFGGRDVAAVIRCDNVYGCQFHPEKSGQTGLTIIKTFLNL